MVFMVNSRTYLNLLSQTRCDGETQEESGELCCPVRTHCD